MESNNPYIIGASHARPQVALSLCGSGSGKTALPPDPYRKTHLAGQLPARMSISLFRMTSNLLDLKELRVSSKTSIVSRRAACSLESLGQSTRGQYAGRSRAFPPPARTCLKRRRWNSTRSCISSAIRSTYSSTPISPRTSFAVVTARAGDHDSCRLELFSLASNGFPPPLLYGWAVVLY